MAKKDKFDRKAAAEKLGKVFKTFGDAVGDIFDDPEVREKAKEFSSTIVDSAAKVVNSHIKDDELRSKFQDVGKAAQSLGKSVATHFTSDE